MAVYKSGAYDQARADAAIDGALKVMREHQPSTTTGRCDACGGAQGCRQREAAVATFSTYMNDPLLVRPYIKA